MHSDALYIFRPTDFDGDFVAIVYMNAVCMKSMTGNINRERFIYVVSFNAKVVFKIQILSNIN